MSAGFLRVAAVSGLALASALLAASGKVSYTGSDPRGTLLTAQAILQHGTLALDPYPAAPTDYRVMTRAGHRFYAYPPGTPIAALPAVAVARLAGLDMSRPDDDDRVQRVLAAISVGLTAILASLLAVRWLPWPLALTLAGIFVFGTPVMSTLGTALWSTNFTVVAVFAALVLVSRYQVASGLRHATLIGVLLGFACWCRPTAIVPAGLVTLWVWGHAARNPPASRRQALIDAGALSGAVLVPLGVLTIVSRLAYGTWLPDYYIGMRLAGSDRFGTALLALLVSPSRGLLIFAPLAVPMLAVTLTSPSRVLRAPLAGLAVIWICVHLAIVSRFPYWWGGYSYGCRLLVEMLPGVFVLTCAASATIDTRSPHWRRLGLAALLAAGALGVWINSVQGLFNPATAAWNASPSIDSFPGYALDWRLPQFRATQARLDDRLQRHGQWLRPALESNVAYTPDSTRLEFAAWSELENVDGSAVRKSIGATPSVRFLVAEDMLHGTDRLMVTVGLGAERPTAGQVWFNGRRVADLTVRSAEREYFVIAIPRALVRTIQYNVLESNVLEWRDTGPDQSVAILLWTLGVHPGPRPDRN